MAAITAQPKLESFAVSVSDGVGVLKYNKPKSANALSGKTLQEMPKALNWVLDHPDVKVVVVTGEGKFFSAGLDLVDAPKEGPLLTDETIEALREIFKLLIETSKVVIAAVNGPAVGFGTTSIALCDLVYSVPDAVFFTPFTKLGLCPEGCSSLSFLRTMGRQKASALLLADDRLTAAELESAGLITKILPTEGFLDRVMVTAKRVAGQAPGGLKATKNLIMAPIRQELLDTNNREMAELKRRTATTEPREAVAAFEREQKAKKQNKSSKL